MAAQHFIASLLLLQLWINLVTAWPKHFFIFSQEKKNKKQKREKAFERNEDDYRVSLCD